MPKFDGAVEVKRCAVQRKKKFRDAGEAARFVQRGEAMRLYLCPHCGFYHLSRYKRAAA